MKGSSVNTSIAVDHNRWWVVIGYEVSMLRGLLAVDARQSPLLIRNIISEGRVLNTRNLCDFCTSKAKYDIKPLDLFENYDTDPRYSTLRGLIDSLVREYGNGTPGDVRWAFNKMLAHPTKERGTSFDYDPYLTRIFPVLDKIILEIESLRGPFEVIS
jgi:hypothetical protein